MFYFFAYCRLVPPPAKNKLYCCLNETRFSVTRPFSADSFSRLAGVLLPWRRVSRLILRPLIHRCWFFLLCFVLQYRLKARLVLCDPCQRSRETHYTNYTGELDVRITGRPAWPSSSSPEVPPSPPPVGSLSPFPFYLRRFLIWGS